MGNEPRYLFFFRSTASATCTPTWRAAFPRLEPAQGLTMVMSSRSALFLSRGWLSKSASAAMSMRNGFSLPFCSLALCRKGHVSSTTNWTLLSLCVCVLSSTFILGVRLLRKHQPGLHMISSPSFWGAYLPYLVFAREKYSAVSFPR